MAWKVELTTAAVKQVGKLDHPVQVRVAKFLRNKVAEAEDPRQSGKALRGEKGELWRYRVGDYRIICAIRDETVTILILSVGHRRDVYR